MKKQLLKESEVRKLMKFANIGALSDGFVSRLEESEMIEAAHEEEEVDPMGDDAEGDEAPAGELDEPVGEPAPDADAPMADEPMADAAPGEVPAELAAAVKSKLIPAMNSVVAAASGGQVTDVFSADVEGEDAAAAPMPAPMEPEADLDAAPDEGAPMDDMDDMEGMDDDEEEQNEAVHAEGDDDPLEEEEDVDLEEDLINEVARRVARRLTRLRSR